MASLVTKSLITGSWGLPGDPIHKGLQVGWPQQEVQQLGVQHLTLLQHILLIQKLSQNQVVPLQQRINVRAGVQIKLPKHGALQRGGQRRAWSRWGD